MKKLLVAAIVAALTVAFALPAAAADLKVSGTFYLDWTLQDYDFNTQYFNDMVSMDLTLDFSEGELMKAHVPLELFLFGGHSDWAPWQYAIQVELAYEKYDPTYFVFSGTPLAFSFSNAWTGDYALGSLGDPLGLFVEAGDYPDYTVKTWGNLFGVDVTGYVARVYEDYPFAYAWAKGAYKLAGEHTLSAYAGLRAEVDANESYEGIYEANYELALNGPVPSLGGTYTLAGAIGTDVWADPNVNYYAFKAGVVDVPFGPFTVDATFSGVEDEFPVVGPDPDVWYDDYKRLNVTADTTVDLAGRSVALTLGDTYRATWVGDPVYNEATGKAVFEIAPKVEMTMDGKIRADLRDGSTSYDGRTVSAGAVYTPAENLEVSAKYTWYEFDKYYYDYYKANYGDLTHNFDFGVTTTPVEGVKLEGTAEYGFDTELALDYTYLEGYGEIVKSFEPGTVKTVNSTVAGLATYDGAVTDAWGYGMAEIVFNDKVTVKGEVLSSDVTENTVFTGTLTYAASDSTTFTAISTYRAYDPNPDDGYGEAEPESYYYAEIAQKLGVSTFKLSWGVSGIGDNINDVDDEDFQAGRLWSHLWLMPADAMDTSLFTLSIEIPF